MTELRSGAPATTPLTYRLAATACGLVFFLLSRRSVLVGVMAGAGLFVVLSALSNPERDDRDSAALV